MVVPQIEASQINSRKHSEREAPQQVGVEEQQLERWHGVEGPRIDLMNLVVLKIKVPKVRREQCYGISLCKETEDGLWKEDEKWDIYSIIT